MLNKKCDIKKGKQAGSGIRKNLPGNGSDTYAEDLGYVKNGADKKRRALQTECATAKGPKESLGPSRKKSIWLEKKKKGREV